jgi:CubicO group peptidase (beta-lactamase class C family)
MHSKQTRDWTRLALPGLLLAAWLSGSRLAAQDLDVEARLKGFDDYMAQILKDWNAPGVGVGIVVKDKLVFAKGYGYRDYDKKLPFTPKTLCPIASNTKLFTAVAAGLLVQEGKLTWDKPVREAVPSMIFYNDQLNNNVTLRDMLAHRTGVTRHDEIWFKSDLTPAELFQRVRYMEPTEPLRHFFIYNNMMFISAGHIIEIKSGQTWSDFVRGRILRPLDMNATVFTIADMTNAADFGVPYHEKRDSRELYRTPYYEQGAGIAPAGGLISDLEDLSHWLGALMNEGKYLDRQVLPAEVLNATLEPAMPVTSKEGESHGFWELQNIIYGMGRETASYRGHLMAYHNGSLEGFYSQISCLPHDHVGVIVLVIGEHCDSLRSTLTYNVFERLLGLDQTPWSQRRLEIYLKDKQAGRQARGKAGLGRVPGAKPSHALAAYAGDYENPAYGLLKIGLAGERLQFDFHKVQLPLEHFHYDRFDTPDDELNGKWSVNFSTNPQGDVDKATMSLDEREAVFVRKPQVPDEPTLRSLAGAYQAPDGAKFKVVFRDGALYRLTPAEPDMKFEPYKGLTFHQREFSDHAYEFILDNGRVTALKETDPSGEVTDQRTD